VYITIYGINFATAQFATQSANITGLQKTSRGFKTSLLTLEILLFNNFPNLLLNQGKEFFHF